MNKKLLTSITLTAILVGLGVPANAQANKLLRTTLSHGVTKTVANVQKGLEKPIFYWGENYKLIEGSLHAKTFGTTPIPFHAVPNKFLRVDIIKDTPETKALHLINQEKILQQELIKTGQEWRANFKQIGEDWSSAQTRKQLRQSLDLLERLPSFKRVISASLNKKNMTEAQQIIEQDFMDYFALGDNAIEATTHYLMRHPKRQTLWLNSRYNSPLITPELRQKIQDLLEWDLVYPSDEIQLKTLFTQVEDCYQHNIARAKDSPMIKVRQDFINTTIRNTKELIAKNGYMPFPSSLNQAELELMDDAEWTLLVLPPFALVEPNIRAIDQFRILWDNSQPPLWEYEKTLQKFTEFVKKYHFSPRNYGIVNTSREELELYDHVTGWIMKDPSTTEDFRRIKKQFLEK